MTLDEALGHEAEELGERILACSSTDARLDRLDAFLTQRLSAAPEPDATMAHVMHRLRSKSVSATAEGLGWSRKRLASWFADRAGILPRQFGRIARFERFSSAIQRDPDVSLAALACDAGYSDQAHLSHDVCRLTGMTPGALRALLLPAQGGVRD
ncbi:helix-turn-helix domain-containing protein [Sphingomonas sp.]|uniref:helix-turn-helix domain-containing protein n=1 Tax=Sphingomonas sp. TaxID=28214 RepID=UPI0025FD5FE5|nr:helix-turn-helix domain-containing protein [Sphingomonas sp.]